MENEKLEGQRGLSKDWMKMLREGTLADRDLYELVIDVMMAQNRDNPTLKEPPKFPPIVRKTFDLASGSVTENPPGEWETLDPERWDPVNNVNLKWSGGWIIMHHQSLDDENSFDMVEFDVSFRRGRSAVHEYFDLRKYPDGSVKAFWLRPEPLYSRLLSEELGEEAVEVTLDSNRINKIAQTILLAHHRTLDEAGV